MLSHRRRQQTGSSETLRWDQRAIASITIIQHSLDKVNIESMGLANHSEDSGFNQTEWVLKGLLSYPIARGGARFAGLDRARASLESLRTDRRATALSLEERIRADFARSSGAYQNVGFVKRQEAAAQRNFELVERSYTLGVASILELLDAQAQLLSAELALNDANFGFLADLVAAERTISFYAFLEPRDDVEALLTPLADELQRAP